MEADKDSKGEPRRTKGKKGHLNAVNICHVLTPDAGERLARAIEILLRSAAALPASVKKRRGDPGGEE